MPTVDDPLLGPLTDDALTRDFRVWQRAKGHRFSSDDLATAYVAWHARPDARRVLDLGCGLGSVLLHLAWKMLGADFVGIEAQAMSFELLRRNVARAGVASRVAIHHGDLRDERAIEALGHGFDLITGTPPYFPPGHASGAMDEQRAYARIEYRGGVEAYLATASRVLAPDGTVVMCGDARAASRVERGAADAKLAVHAHCEIIPRENEKPLFAIWTFGRTPRALARSSMTLRDAAGERTREARMLREFSGLEEARSA
ncbi:MAG TPA: methyltransferase domain-containing protein [Polyangiaceae bacterium]